MQDLPPCPRCGSRLSWSCAFETGSARCKAGQSRGSDRTPRALLCQFQAEIERTSDGGVRFRYPDEVSRRESVRKGVLRELEGALRACLSAEPSFCRYLRPDREDPHMTEPVSARFRALPSSELEAVRAQLEDLVPCRDGVLTHEQAMSLITEVLRLREQVQAQDARVRTLMGILS